MVPELLILALDFYRAPLRYPDLASPVEPLPESFDNLIGAFAGALSPRNIEATAQALGTSPAVTERASLFFLRQVLLVSGGDHYRVLGLSPHASEADIREHYHLLVRIFHPDRSEGDPERNAEYTARINDAYNTLKRPDTRQRYDRQRASALRGRRTTNIDIDRFHPKESVASNPVCVTGAVSLRAGNRRTRLLLAGVVVVVVVVVALALWVSSPRPVLRANPELANASIAEPFFLRERASSGLASSLAQRPGLSRGKTDDAATGETYKQLSVPVAETPAAAFPAEYRFGQSPVERMSRDEIRNAAAMGLALHPEAPGSAALEGPVGKSSKVSPSVGQTANPPQTPFAAPSPQTGKPVLAQSSNTAYPNVQVTRADGADGDKQDGATVAADAPVRGASAERPAMARTQNANRLPEAKAGDADVGIADAQIDKVAVIRKESGSVAKIEASIRRPNVQARSSVTEERAKLGASTSAAQRARTPEIEPIAKTAKEQGPGRRRPPSKGKTERQSTPEQTIARLTRYYRAGDVQGLVDLFTADAHVTDGRGKSAIRSDYAGLFARTSDRRLSIRNLKWKRAGNGNVIGKGTYRAGTKRNPKASWRYSTGTLHIKLVPRRGDYKIAEFFH